MPDTITRPYDWVIPASYRKALLTYRVDEENSYFDTVLSVLNAGRPLPAPESFGDDMVEVRLYVPENLKAEWIEAAGELGLPLNAWLCQKVFDEIPERIRICRGENGTLARVRFYGQDAIQVSLAHSLDDLYELSIHKAGRELFLRGLDSRSYRTQFDGGGEMLPIKFWLTGEDVKRLEQVRSENPELGSLSESLAIRAVILGGVGEVIARWL